MENNMKRKLSILLMAHLLLFAAHVAAKVSAQESNRPPEPGVQSGQFEDPIQQLRLTPEQRQQIRSIREQMRDERAAINERRRAANQALDEALDADQPDEALVEQRLREVASAQAAQMRMNILMEVRIRRVLTPEQRAVLRELRQAVQFRRQRQQDNQRRPNAPNGQRRFPNGRNTLGPAVPKNLDPPRP